MLRKSLYIGIFYFFVLNSVVSQIGNPFEVRQDSLESLENGELLQNNVEEKENVFEIRSDSINITAAPESITDTSQSVIESLDLNKKNPFEVSHIPLRKAKKTNTTRITSPTERSKGQFLFWILLFASIVFAIVFSQNYSNVVKISRSILNDNILRQSMHQEGSGTSLLFLVLYFLFAINASILVYKFVNIDGNFAGFSKWSIILGSVIILYLSRHLCYRILGFIFPIKKEISHYSYTTGLINVFLGLILLPMNLFIVFAPDKLSTVLIYTGLVMIAFFYLFRLFRGGFIFSRLMNSNIFHIFIYICTCEIAPLLIMYRFLVS